MAATWRFLHSRSVTMACSCMISSRRITGSSPTISRRSKSAAIAANATCRTTFRSIRKWPYQNTNARQRRNEPRSCTNAQRSRPDQCGPADNPECRFNSLKCEHGLAGLREYCRDWDDRLKVFKDSQKHNWASHAADAFGYMATGWKQAAKPEPTPRPPLYKPLSAISYDEYDDDIEITYQGTKIIRAERQPRRPDRV
jgi:hypothetical protein